MDFKNKMTAGIMTIALVGSVIVPSMVAGISNASALEASALVDEMSSPAYTPLPTMPLAVKVKGDIAPDFSYEEESKVRKDFELLYRSTVNTDEKGIFEMSVPYYPYEIDITVKKAGYLTRVLKKVNIKRMETNLPKIEMWAGDMNMDNIINMADIMMIANVFNTTEKDESYLKEADFNESGDINMVDIMTVSKHFNETSDSYPEYIQKY